MAERRLLSRRGLVVALVVLALSTSLATRVFHAHHYTDTAAHSSSVGEKVQHRDKDAVEWAPPTAHLVVLWVAEPTISSETDDNVYVNLHYDSLYNRPPPVL